jgi:hypothetical protein
MRATRGSLSAAAAAGRVGFGRRGSRTPTVGGHLRQFGRWLRTQYSPVARPRPTGCRRSRVMSRLCTCCRWFMSTTTRISPRLLGSRVSRWPGVQDRSLSPRSRRVRPVPAGLVGGSVSAWAAHRLGAARAWIAWLYSRSSAHAGHCHGAGLVGDRGYRWARLATARRWPGPDPCARCRPGGWMGAG